MPDARDVWEVSRLSAHAFGASEVASDEQTDTHCAAVGISTADHPQNSTFGVC